MFEFLNVKRLVKKWECYMQIKLIVTCGLLIYLEIRITDEYEDSTSVVITLYN